MQELQVFIAELFNNFGYLGLFIASLIANATIILPVPIDFLIFGIGAMSNNLFVVLIAGFIAGLGAALGEMTSYLIGRMGHKGLEKVKPEDALKIERLTKRIKNKGIPIIALGAFTPFPFDLIGIAAGLIKYDPKKFLIGALIGKIPRYILLGLAGYYGLSGLRVAFFGA